MTSSQQRKLSKLVGSHKSTHVKFATWVNNYKRLNYHKTSRFGYLFKIIERVLSLL